MVPLALAGSPSRAGTVVAGASSAYHVSVDLDATILGNSASVSVGPAALAQGAAPAPYSAAASLPGVNASAGTTNVNLGLAQVQIVPAALALDTSPLRPPPMSTAAPGRASPRPPARSSTAWTSRCWG